ncbi:MAG TPA: hypothetical protein VFW20_10990 [Candidatus Limnocylindrales bacterium]|nr:hypothetical protein [Candidatus Limnocylindrales bacterium]
MVRPLVPALRSLGLIALGLVLAHQAVYLARYGSIYGEALVHSGHGQAWSDTVTTVLAGAAILAAVALFRLWRLRALVVESSNAGRGRPARGFEGQRLARAWIRMLAVIGPSVAIALTLQENLEHLASGYGLPGPAILASAEYPMALPIVALVAAVVSFVAALFAWTREVLVARLRASRARLHAPRRLRPAVAATTPAIRGSLLARRLGRRAPPIALPA